MSKILYQLLGENTEELWYFPYDIEIETIKAFYKQYEESVCDDFEQFMNEFHSEIDCERVFVEEVNI